MTNDPSKPTNDPQTKNQNPHRGLNLIREIFIVIIGVLVALAADDWQENKERDQRDEQVMQMVLAELNNNLKQINLSGDYHQRMYDGLTTSMDKLAKENVFELPTDWNDSQEISTISSAFQLALLSGTLSRIDAELAVKLSGLYDDLDDYDRRRNQIGLSTLQTSFSDGSRYLALQRVALFTELSYKETMLPQFESAIERITQFQQDQ